MTCTKFKQFEQKSETNLTVSEKNARKYSANIL